MLLAASLFAEKGYTVTRTTRELGRDTAIGSRVRHLTLALLNLFNLSIFWWSDFGDLTSQELAEMRSSLYLEGARAPSST
jgi:hypothetical protein